MELVYPIYLDTPMMTAFLASLEGGILEEANIESKTSNAKQTSGKATFGAKVSNLVSALVDINAQADVSRQVSDNLESQYKGTVRFPNASLFIRLRKLLIEQKIINVVSNKKDFDKVSLGDIVELQGETKSSPSYEIRRAVNQLMPVAAPMLKMQLSELENQLTRFKKFPTKNNKGVKFIQIGDQDFNISEIISDFENQIGTKQQQLNNLQELAIVTDKLFAEENSSNIIFNSNSFSSVCKVYPTFARNEQIQEILDANWRCVGKVIGKLDSSESYDLFKGLPVGLLAKNLFLEMTKGFKTEELDISVPEPIISGSTLIIAVLAIFA